VNSFTIKGATIIDGSGSKGFQGDVIVENGIISEISDKFLKHSVGLKLNGDGLTLTPGFIDMHSHSDLGVLNDKEHLSKVTQGVTLELVGQDGLGYVPADPRTQNELRSQLYGWTGPASHIDWNFSTVSDYLRQVDEGCAVNVAYLVPHGTVRMSVKGMEDGLATPDEIGKMRELVRQGMLEGAFGLSAGLTYVPAMYSDTNELVELCSIAASMGGFYSPHHRNYGLGLYDSIQECLDISRKSKAPLHLTHCHVSHPAHHGKASELLEVIDAALGQGLDITLDSYPYLAGMTYLHALLPSWVQSGGMAALGKRLSASETQAKVIEALDHLGTDGAQGATVNWANVVIAGVERSENKRFVGKSIAENAELLNVQPSRLYLDLLLSEDFKASMVTFGGNEENVRTIIKHGVHMAGSDGILHGDRPHPRAYGTFARYLGHYALQEKVISLEGAIARMTGRPAARLGLRDRGLVRSGYRADLVLFDELNVRDQSTYESPRKPASGFVNVWIDGIATLQAGKRTEATPGRGIRKGK